MSAHMLLGRIRLVWARVGGHGSEGVGEDFYARGVRL